MGTKEYLSLIKKYDKMIANKLLEYCQINSMAYSICVGGDGDRVQTSGNKDKVGSIVSKMVDLETEIDVLAKERKKIVSEIEDIDDSLHYDLLAKRYILGMSNQEVAYEVKMSEEEVSREFKKAIDGFGELHEQSILLKFPQL